MRHVRYTCDECGKEAIEPKTWFGCSVHRYSEPGRESGSFANLDLCSPECVATLASHVKEIFRIEGVAQ